MELKEAKRIIIDYFEKELKSFVGIEGKYLDDIKAFKSVIETLNDYL